MLHSPSRRQLIAFCIAAAASFGAAAGPAPTVKFATSMGDFVIELDPVRAPKTVDNFVQYVKAGHYNGTIFHRVIPNFMIQGGGMTAGLTEKATRAPIALESRNGLKNLRGSVAMARTGDPNSATAQFFVNVVDNDFLNASASADGYAVFGRVVSGMDVVDRIRNVPTSDKGPSQSNVPLQPVLINAATLQP